MNQAVMGLFTYVDVLLEAAKRLKDSGYTISIFSSIPLAHEIEPVLGERPNYIRYFTFFGGVCGVIFGLVLTLGTAVMYVLPRGGRPLFSATPTLLITYEATILLGVLFTLLGFAIIARLPSYRKKIYDPEVAVDSFGLLVDDIREDKFDEVEQILKEFGEVEQILKEFGADEVKRFEKP
jgi:molybdopterin-containing oxidoreductase family membrane subunit